MSDNIPTAVWEGVFTVFGVEVHCSVLDDGQRVIDADDVVRMLAAMEDRNVPIDRDGFEAFARWQKGYAS